MILYWSDTNFQTASDVKNNANFVEVDPLDGGSFLPSEFVIVHKQGNGLSIDNNVGWTDSIELTISEDELSRPIIFQGSTFYGIHAVKAFLRTQFKWIQSERVNEGEVIGVMLGEAPQWKHALGKPKFLEVTIKLQGRVFHQNS